MYDSYSFLPNQRNANYNYRLIRQLFDLPMHLLMRYIARDAGKCVNTINLLIFDLS